MTEKGDKPRGRSPSGKKCPWFHGSNPKTAAAKKADKAEKDKAANASDVEKTSDKEGKAEPKAKAKAKAKKKY